MAISPSPRRGSLQSIYMWPAKSFSGHIYILCCHVANITKLLIQWNRKTTSLSVVSWLKIYLATQVHQKLLLWLPYVTGGPLYFCPVVSFLLSSSSFFSSPNLIGRRLDVYYTLTHGVKCAACGSLQIRDAKKSPKIAIWAPSHNFDGPYLRN